MFANEDTSKLTLNGQAGISQRTGRTDRLFQRGNTNNDNWHLLEIDYVQNNSITALMHELTDSTH